MTKFNSPALLAATIVLLTAIGFGTPNPVSGQTDGKEPSQSTTAKQKPRSSTPSQSRRSPPTKFLRVLNGDSGKPVSMQTAITRYRPAKGNLVVDLIGAVHIGEADYYSKLNQQFEHYDVVLYELVAPQGTRIPAGGKRKSKSAGSPLDMVGWMQKQAQTTLGLESQLEKIDYQKRNLVHADLSPTQMGEKMAERGDTAITVGLSALSEIIRQQNQTSSSKGKIKASNLANSLGSESLMDMINDPLKMKLMMASQFSESGVMDMGLGATLNQLIVTDRNIAAMKVLQKQVVQGNKKIAIFYGAAHMPDFEDRLVEEFGMSKTKQIWVDAWDLTKAGKKPKTSGTTKMLFRLLDELGK